MQVNILWLWRDAVSKMMVYISNNENHTQVGGTYHDGERCGRFVGWFNHTQVQAVLTDGSVVQPHLLTWV